MGPTIEKLSRTDAGLASALRVSVARLNRRLRTERDPDSDQLSPGQFAVLGLLDRLGETAVGELAAHERVQPPSMTRTVTCLEESGYVTRRAHDSDRRQVVVALSEQGRELASLRVLGFTRGEIAYILLGELALLVLASIPLGFLVGWGLSFYFISTIHQELFRVPLILEPDTFALAASIVLASALVSALIVRRRLDRLDLIAVLKTKE